MSAQAFESLIGELTKKIGREVRAEGQGVVVEINDVSFTLLHGPAWGEGHMLFACDFGDLPEPNRQAVLERALEANIQMQGLWSPIFALSPQTGRLTLMAALPVEMLDAGAMWDTLMGYVGVVHYWRKTYFLEKPIAT